MNVYDFDGTIYDGDSTVDFFFYLVKKKPIVLKVLPAFMYDAVKYKLKLVEKTFMKETFYQFLNILKKGEIEKLVKDFWKTNKKKIFKFYKRQHKNDDVVISASPRFILGPICKQLKVKKLICSEVDSRTGLYEGKNCRDVEKVNRFFKEYPKRKKLKYPIDNFYTDSKADLPLIAIAKNTYFVDKKGDLSLFNNDI